MKRIFFVIACSFVFAKVVDAQTVSLNIDAGILQNTLGTAPEPVGGLVELIASPSGTFSAPTSASYVTGDNILVSSFAMTITGSGNTQGLLAIALNGLPLTNASRTLTAGESLLLRFYPSLTYTNMPTAPTLGTTYGQVRSSTAEFGPTVDPSETGWFVPAAGSTIDLNYITTSAGGTYANASAFATNVVLVGVIPEPSTYAMFGIGFAGLLGLRAWNRRDYGARRTT